MSSTRCPSISEEVWETHREKILFLHGKVSQKELQETMKQEHNFAPSKSQWTTQFAKWKLQKYQWKGTPWDKVLQTVDSRENKSEVLIGGERVTQRRLQQERRRLKKRQQGSRYPTPADYSMTLPSHIQIRTPPMIRRSLITPAPRLLSPSLPANRSNNFDNGRPTGSQVYSLQVSGSVRNMYQPSFTNLENLHFNFGPHSNDTRFLSTLYQNSAPGLEVLWSPTKTTIQNLEWIQRLPQHIHALSATKANAMHALVISNDGTGNIPTSMYPLSVSNELSKQSPAVQYLYSVLFRLANNLVPLKAFTEPKGPEETRINHTVRLLLSLGDLAVVNLLKSAPPVFAEGLKIAVFRAAVELDAARTVEALIREGMDLTKISNSGWAEYLPLERATILGHFATAKTLLALGAKADEFIMRRPLAYLLQPSLDQKSETLSVNEVSLINLLLQYNAKLCPVGYSREVCSARISDRRVIECIIQNINNLDAIFFFEHGTLAMILQSYEKAEACTALKLVMAQPWFQEAKTREDFTRIMYAGLCNAVFRNNHEAMEILLSSGVRTSPHCLYTAIRSGNIEAARRVMYVCGEINGNESNYEPSDYGNGNRRDIFLLSPSSYPGGTAIAEAIRCDCVEALALFEEAGHMKTIATSDFGLTCALRAAVEVGDTPMFNFLSTTYGLPKNSSIIMHEASAIQRWDIVELLLQQGHSPFFSTLMNAVSAQNKEMCMKTLHYSLPYSPEDSLETILRDAVQWGHLDVIKLLLSVFGLMEYPLKDNFRRDSSGSLYLAQGTVLSAAILNKNMGLVSYLLTAGAELNKGHSYERMTPLAAAVKIRDFNLFKHLIMRGADPFDNAAIFVAAENEFLEFVEALLKAFNERYPKGQKFYGCQALCKAVEMGHSKLLRTLLECADPNGFDFEDSFAPLQQFWSVSALGAAIANKNGQSNSTKMVRILIENGTDVNGPVTRDERGHQIPAVNWAIKHRKLEALEELVDHHANIKIPASFGVQHTPLQLASKLGEVDVVKYLLVKGADPNEQTTHSYGYTSLQLAAESGNIAIAKLLVEEGANINARSGRFAFVTAFELASKNGRIAMMEYLYNNGVDLVTDDGKQYQKAKACAEERNQTAACLLVDEMYQKQRATVIHITPSPEESDPKNVSGKSDPASFWKTYLSRKKTTEPNPGSEPSLTSKETSPLHADGPIGEARSVGIDEHALDDSPVPWETPTLGLDGLSPFEGFFGMDGNVDALFSIGDNINDVPIIFDDFGNDIASSFTQQSNPGFPAPTVGSGLRLEQDPHTDDLHDFIDL